MNKQWKDNFAPQLKFMDDGSGQFAGYLSTFGNVDAGRDIVVKGAFAQTIPTFLKDGFIALGHDWNGLQIGYPTAAHEDDHGLWIEAAFHSTSDAQDARTVMRERMTAGKSVGLSIGYGVSPGGWEPRDDGVRLLKSVDLFEGSMVTVPMNAMAGVAAAKDGIGLSVADIAAWLKSVDLDDPAVLGAALSYAEHLALGATLARLSLKESQAVAQRVVERIAYRKANPDHEEKVGRVLSERNGNMLMDHAGTLNDHGDTLHEIAKSITKLVEDNRPANDVIEDPKPNPKKDAADVIDVQAAHEAFLRIEALMNGVAA